MIDNVDECLLYALMKNNIFRIGLFLFIAVAPHAHASNAGVETAAKMCQGIGFSDDVTKCNQLVSSASYFDVSAVNICSGFSFANRKLPCLEKIKNKTFSPALVASCKSLTFDDKILDCLGVSGKLVQDSGGDDDEGTPSRRRVKQALRQLDKGNYGKVRELLKEMLSDTK